MNMDIIKESMIESAESIYALTINYLKDTNNMELKSLLKELELLEDKVRVCDRDKLDNYKILLDNLIRRIEAIINE